MAVAPAGEAVGGVGALSIEFLLLCFAIVAFGMVRFSQVLVHLIQFVVSNSIGKLPLIGWIVHEVTDPVFRAAERGLADVALGVQGAIGFYWHGLAWLASFLAHEIEHQAVLIWHLAHYALPTTWGELIGQELARIRNAVNVVEHTGSVAIQRVHTVERTIVTRAQAAVLPRVHGIEGVIGHVVLPDIAGLRERARAIADHVENLFQQTRKLDALLGTAAFTGAVAFALARLDVSWIRCRNWNRIGKGICGLPSDLLETLLAGTIDALVVSDLCDFAYLLGQATREVEPALLSFVSVENALIGCHGTSRPPTRNAGVLNLPPLINAVAV